MNESRTAAPVTREEIARIVYPNNPEGDPLVFKLMVVTTTGKKVERVCTKECYESWLKNRPDKDSKTKYYLKIDAEGVVYDYSPVIDAAPGAFQQEMPDGRVIKSADRLIAERRVGTKEFDPVFVPRGVSAANLTQVLAALDAASVVEVGDVVLGRYKIFETAQREGKEVVTLEMSQQS